MHVTFTEEEIAFRDEVRSFFRDELPADIREKQAQGVPLERDDSGRGERVVDRFVRRKQASRIALANNMRLIGNQSALRIV